MFRGSAHVKPEEHGQLVNGVGGYSNANTWFDRTNYVNTLPSNQLDLALYLEADRMAELQGDRRRPTGSNATWSPRSGAWTTTSPTSTRSTGAGRAVHEAARTAGRRWATWST